ncbi:MAG: hypothetical protein J5937_01635 [Paludibacteraceae bacterium]|nr:hypothetical protein [Paludibacteraceae bacterium]
MTLVFSGCKKENNDPQEPAKVQTYRMSINASKGTDQQANGPRKVIGLDGTTLTATWTTGDKVYVYKGGTELGYLEASDNNANTQLNGTLTGEVSVGDELTLKYLSANYTGQNGTLTYISANCDYATASVTVETVAGGEITTTADANFENQQAIVKFTLKDAADHTTLLSPTALIFNDGTANIATLTIPAATYTTNDAGVLYVAVPGFSGKDITLTATVGSDTYTFNKTSTTLTNGQYYILTVEMTKQAPAYKEYGPFSVSPTQKVNFAQGNLQFTRTSTFDAWSTGTFSFMDNQYDYIETTASQYCTDDYANETAIGLFGWATSNINEPANTYYYPWETDKTSASYGSGITTANVNWAKDYANYDWGKNMGTGWRTLTKDEWTYLFNTTNSSDASVGRQATYRFAKAKLFGTTYGIILFPDNYVHPSGVAAVAGLNATGNTSWNGNMYNATDWKKMEDAGCVFLPAAGFRNGTSMSNVGSCGYYWSSTSNSGTKAYFAYFTGNLVLPGSLYDRYYGFSVRLVKNVE